MEYIIISSIVICATIGLKIIGEYGYSKVFSLKNNPSHNFLFIAILIFFLIIIGLNHLYTNTYVTERCFAQKTPLETFIPLVCFLVGVLVFLIRKYQRRFNFFFPVFLLILCAIIFSLITLLYHGNSIKLCQQPPVFMENNN